MTGETYQSSVYAKAMLVSESKVGKSCFMVASALGVLPWQKYGGIVDRPENLHILTFDANALGGIARFLTETCKAPKEALKFRVYNMQEDLRQVSVSGDDWDYTLLNTVSNALNLVRDRAKGVPVLHISSLTGLAQALERALAGPPGTKKGAGMDQSKWGAFSHQLNEIRNFAQLDLWHCLWEAHVYKPAATGQDKTEVPKESLQISGKSGQSFPYNVEQVFRVRRQFGSTYKDSNCDITYLDTRPAMDFIANGRGFTESLEPKEYDLTKAFQKLGLKVGGWGAKKLKAVEK